MIHVNLHHQYLTSSVRSFCRFLLSSCVCQLLIKFMMMMMMMMSSVLFVIAIQMFFIAFLCVYGVLIVTKFYHNPFTSPGRDYEVCVFLYVCGIAFEEALQASSLLICICILCLFLVLLGRLTHGECLVFWCSLFLLQLQSRQSPSAPGLYRGQKSAEVGLDL